MTSSVCRLIFSTFMIPLDGSSFNYVSGISTAISFIPKNLHWYVVVSGRDAIIIDKVTSREAIFCPLAIRFIISSNSNWSFHKLVPVITPTNEPLFWFALFIHFPNRILQYSYHFSKYFHCLLAHPVIICCRFYYIKIQFGFFNVSKVIGVPPQVRILALAGEYSNLRSLTEKHVIKIFQLIDAVYVVVLMRSRRSIHEKCGREYAETRINPSCFESAKSNSDVPLIDYHCAIKLSIRMILR